MPPLQIVAEILPRDLDEESVAGLNAFLQSPLLKSRQPFTKQFQHCNLSRC